MSVIPGKNVHSLSKTQYQAELTRIEGEIRAEQKRLAELPPIGSTPTATPVRRNAWDRVNAVAKFAAPVAAAALLIGGAATFAPKANAQIFDGFTGQRGSVEGCINSLGYPEECPDAEPNPGLSEIGKQEAAWAKQYGWDK